MSSYSSYQFYKDWRFRIKQDFVTYNGHPFDYAPGGLQEWGDERLKIPFPVDDDKNKPDYHRPGIAALSHDGKYVAVSAGLAIQVIDVATFERTYLLEGHTSEVDYISFRPGSSTQLVSTAMESRAGSTPADAQIIFWDLTKLTPSESTTPLALERLTRNAANSIIGDLKSMIDVVQVSASDQATLARSLEDPILKLLNSKCVPDIAKLFGRLTNSFQSQIFNQSGDLMIYMPGNRPQSNDVADWELRVYNVEQRTDYAVMSGHTDSIMWTDFSPDGSLVGSASWDGTFRIWDVKTGIVKHRWGTGYQNWTGAFSPNGQYFAGTSGDGKLHVYDLQTGGEILSKSLDNGWCRALTWHPTSQTIAVGCSNLGSIFLIGIDKGDIHQYRCLSLEASKMPERTKRGIGGFLEVTNLHFVDGGRKLALFTGGDGSAEVYDLENHIKWRFARAGTMNSPDDDSEVKSQGGFQSIVAEDHTKKEIVVASIDSDAVRFWSVPMEQ